jgi:ketosteroid isomerase-like protein
MLEIIVLGFAIVALVLPVFSAVGTLAEARGIVDVTAADAAAWFARHGELPAGIDDGIDIEVQVQGDVVQVVASTTVRLIGRSGPDVTLAARATAVVSPYRSRR